MLSLAGLGPPVHRQDGVLRLVAAALGKSRAPEAVADLKAKGDNDDYHGILRECFSDTAWKNIAKELETDVKKPVSASAQIQSAISKTSTVVSAKIFASVLTWTSSTSCCDRRLWRSTAWRTGRLTCLR